MLHHGSLLQTFLETRQNIKSLFDPKSLKYISDFLPLEDSSIPEQNPVAALPLTYPPEVSGAEQQASVPSFGPPHKTLSTALFYSG